jgi:hypothetical protein
LLLVIRLFLSGFDTQGQTIDFDHGRTFTSAYRRIADIPYRPFCTAILQAGLSAGR